MGADFVNGMLAAAATLAPSPNFTLPSVVTVGGQTIGLNGSLTVLAPTVPGDRLGTIVTVRAEVVSAVSWLNPP
jgi:hypothetical protein